VSTGIHRDLTAPPPSRNRIDGTKRDRTGLKASTERLATNQKVAGSSPAERAEENPANGGVWFLASSFPGSLDHLSLRETPREGPRQGADPEALADRAGDPLLPQGARRVADRTLVVLADLWSAKLRPWGSRGALWREA
jgi:hypothetical protein